jgi:hypothetical protein
MDGPLTWPTGVACSGVNHLAIHYDLWAMIIYESRYLLYITAILPH